MERRIIRLLCKWELRAAEGSSVKFDDGIIVWYR